ncbi:phospholipid/cholesterol/gamma-HCH transport system substrate-binding protein [Lutibacter oricola]|uniref:Phospholipid/cholesterol/gamma-HCH transport system substrate-binding protein n=1 Tax=Lutibacter oricola TaxID=762486 RepID=A0A1H3C3Y0_9FLAO|nr:MlaD family protein [Lutibacter oricola]SDX48877.1 phospholipid/cholesterol/gamma-HCH transport system substrate-binding protein [Lutibacter oricola]
MKITRELKTGIFAVVVIGLFIWGYNFLKGLNMFDGPLKTYKTEYANVQGLNTASVVTINGVEVGKVVNIEFDKAPERRGHLIVEFSVENDFEFSKKSIAKIYSASLMGGKSLAIVPSYEGEMAEPGDYLSGEIESDIFSSVTEKLNPLQAKVENVIVSADSLMVGLNDIIDAKSRKSIKESIAQLNSVVSNFKQVSQSVNTLVKNNEEKLGKTLNNAEVMTKNLAKLSDTLSNANIGSMVKNLETTVTSINAILTNVEQGKGSLGKLMKDDGMYTNLTNASKELEELLNEMKLHPKRFVHFSLFGKKDKGYKPEVEKKQ